MEMEMEMTRLVREIAPKVTLAMTAKIAIM